jgi:hypothetical protein
MRAGVRDPQRNDEKMAWCFVAVQKIIYLSSQASTPPRTISGYCPGDLLQGPRPKIHTCLGSGLERCIFSAMRHSTVAQNEPVAYRIC